jgi:hypothetical protein
MRREGGLRGGSIAEPQAFEAGCSPQAIAKDLRVPDVLIHLFEVPLLSARAQERQRIRHHPHVAMAEHCRHAEQAGFAYYAAPYSWQTPKSGRPKPPFSRTASIESGAILSPKMDRAVQNCVSSIEATGPVRSHQRDSCERETIDQVRAGDRLGFNASQRLSCSQLDLKIDPSPSRRGAE